MMAKHGGTKLGHYLLLAFLFARCASPSKPDATAVASIGAALMASMPKTRNEPAGKPTTMSTPLRGLTAGDDAGTSVAAPILRRGRTSAAAAAHVLSTSAALAIVALRAPAATRRGELASCAAARTY